MVDRRKHLHYTDLSDLLQQLPARVLLDRMPGPVLGVELDGVVGYANPAAVSLLGYLDGALLGRSLPTLLDGHSQSSPEDCMALLRASGGGDVVNWSHADGFPIRTAVSTPLLLRATDPYLMVSLTDVTELHWS